MTYLQNCILHLISNLYTTFVIFTFIAFVFVFSCSINIMITVKTGIDVVLIVEAGACLFAVDFNIMPMPSRRWNWIRNFTLMAARWMVCGIHRIRESEAQKSIPAAWHLFSNAFINVSLLLALSIITAII